MVLREDLWALGVVSYELMHLDLPFKGTSLPVLLQNITSNSPKPLPDTYSKSLRQLIKMLLSKQPSKRPSVESILSHKCFFAQSHSDHAKIHHREIGKVSQVSNVIKNESHNHSSTGHADPTTASTKWGSPNFTRPSSLHHRLNQQLLTQNQSDNQNLLKSKTWDECLKEAHANIHTTNNLLPSRRSRSIANPIYVPR
jgi:serine/threonine protein kinase